MISQYTVAIVICPVTRPFSLSLFRFSSTSPTGSRAGVDPVEGGSLFGGTVTTGTPQLSMGSAAQLLNAHAPSYIDPPSFEETVMHSRSRSHSATSAYNQDFNRPVRDWDEEQGSGIDLPPHGFNNPSVAYAYEDSENSIEKNPDDLVSDDTDRESEHTQYSHLAGVAQPSPGGERPAAFHHQLNLPLSASSSAGMPMSFGEMVDNRLLRGQSEDTELPLNYATYV